MRVACPTDYEMNLSLGYNLNVGPVTITPQVYAFDLLNRQTDDGDRRALQPERELRHGSGQPVLRTGRRRAGDDRTAGQRLPGDRHGSVHRQPELQEDDGSGLERVSSGLR